MNLRGGSHVWIFLWVGYLIPGLSGLLSADDMNLVFANPIKEGDDLKLICMFKFPTNVTIYTVKWYKGTREIFRYFPKDGEKQPVKFGNLTIDERHSNMNTLILKHVPAYMTGNVSCEVTPDPPFNVVTKTLPLIVAVPPKQKPRLETTADTKNKMLVQNQKMSVNCTSSPSKPTVNLTFYINDQLVRPDDPHVGIRMHPRILSDDFELMSAELEFQLQQKYFMNGKIKVKCIASMYNLYSATSEVFVGMLSQPRSQKQGSILFGSSGATRINPGKIAILGLFTILSTASTKFY